MNIKLLSFLTVILGVGLVSCGDDDVQVNNTMTLNLTGLEDLGPDYAYEGWVMVDGAPVSTGVFNVDSNGSLSKSSFDVENLSTATAFILTIEPSPDSDPNPSKVHLVAGDFSGNSASLTVDHSAAIGNDFTSSTGGFILATPTNGSDTNEDSGIWFLDITSGSPLAALDLPTLPEGWAYEGWVVIDGTPVTTGTFTSNEGEDASAPFSGTMGGPPFPGEDFLNNAPAGLSFPTALQGGTAVISVEPVPDNSTNPFLLKPLVQGIDAAAVDHVYYTMGNNAANTNPTGSVTR